MEYGEFVEEVQKKGQISTPTAAEHSIGAVLKALSQRLAGGAPGNLAAQLPEEVSVHLGDKGGEESFSLEEFFERVARDERGNVVEARQHAEGVMQAVITAIKSEQADKLRRQLPEDYQYLLHREVPSATPDAATADVPRPDRRVPVDEAPERKAERRARAQRSGIVP